MAKRRIVLETDVLVVTYNKKANTYTITSKTNQSGIPEGKWEDLQLLAQAIINKNVTQETPR